MVQPGRRVELIMSVDEAQPREEATRGPVRGVVPREKSLGPNDPERMVDGTRRRLECVGLLAATRGDMDAKFGSAWIVPVGSKTAAPDVLPGSDEEDQPALNTVTPLCLDREGIRPPLASSGDGIPAGSDPSVR
jgi:hypothetical protein